MSAKQKPFRKTKKHTDSRPAPPDEGPEQKEEQVAEQAQEHPRVQIGKPPKIVIKPPEKTPTEDEKTSADYYFESYAHFGIHEEMLKDTVRTRTYQRAIMQNPHLFRDKIVLDVGAGTGILSMFCAKAGAKHVYAVECASIADQAKEIIKANKLDSIITVVKGKIEELVLPVEKVDIIVSEWMGYFLLYESMLDSVVFARDKWLAPNGLIFPDKATLYLTACEDRDYRDEKIEFWNNVYGFDMKVIREQALSEPLVDMVEAGAVCALSTPILAIDIYKVTKEELASFNTRFRIEFTRADYCHALVAFFDIRFTHCHTKMGFATGPSSHYTHWKQTVFYLDQELVVEKGESLLGTITVKQNSKNKRDLDISFATTFEGAKSNVEQTRHYRLRQTPHALRFGLVGLCFPFLHV